VNQNEQAIFVAFMVFYLRTLGLYYLIVFRVNKMLPPDERIPFSLSTGRWNELKTLYRGLYPRSSLYQLTLQCAVTLLVLA
jgi:hypothetical protein